MLEVGDGIWTIPFDRKFGGLLKLNTRMTVCRLSDGGLLLHSPTPCSEDLKSAIDALGPVRALVSPNLWHHLYIGEWIDAYPGALSYAPPGLAAKRSDLRFDRELGPAFDEEFGGEVFQIPIAGMPRLNEFLFLHRQSEALIVADFCFFLPDSAGLTRLFAVMMGIDKRVRCEALFKYLIKDKASFRASLQPLRNMEIRHLSMCHHDVLSVGAREALQGVLDQLKVN